MIDQIFDNLNMTIEVSKMQGGVAEMPLSMDIGAPVQQQVHSIEMAAAGRIMQRRGSCSILGVNVISLVEQPSNLVCISRIGGIMQRFIGGICRIEGVFAGLETQK